MCIKDILLSLYLNGYPRCLLSEPSPDWFFWTIYQWSKIWNHLPTHYLTCQFKNALKSLLLSSQYIPYGLLIKTGSSFPLLTFKSEGLLWLLLLLFSCLLFFFFTLIIPINWTAIPSYNVPCKQNIELRLTFFVLLSTRSKKWQMSEIGLHHVQYERLINL